MSGTSDTHTNAIDELRATITAQAVRIRDQASEIVRMTRRIDELNEYRDKMNSRLANESDPLALGKENDQLRAGQLSSAVEVVVRLKERLASANGRIGALEESVKRAAEQAYKKAEQLTSEKQQVNDLRKDLHDTKQQLVRTINTTQTLKDIALNTSQLPDIHPTTQRFIKTLVDRIDKEMTTLNLPHTPQPSPNAKATNPTPAPSAGTETEAMYYKRLLNEAAEMNATYSKQVNDLTQQVGQRTYERDLALGTIILLGRHKVAPFH